MGTDRGAPPVAVAQGDSRESQSIYCSSTSQTFSVVKDQIPSAMIPELQRDFTPRELEEIFNRANLRTAKPAEQPVCLWILGSSAVGKSFITGAKASQYFGVIQNAVIIDGTEFREVHAGFQAVRKHGQENGVLHSDAWTTFRKTCLVAKDGKVTLKRRILMEAIEGRRHLIVPDCCNNLPRLEELIQEVRAAGYQMHAVCLWAPLSVTRLRGEERSVREGKLWTPKEYPASTKGTLNIAMRWLDGMRDEPNLYRSLELWDNTHFPAIEVGLEQYGRLVMMSDADADAHATELDVQHYREHSNIEKGNQQARERLRDAVRRVSRTLLEGSPWLAGPSGRNSESETPSRFEARFSEADAHGEGRSGRFEAAFGPADPMDPEAALSTTKGGTAFAPAPALAKSRSRDWRRRLEGAVPGLLAGLAIGVAVGRLWWSACEQAT